MVNTIIERMSIIRAFIGIDFDRELKNSIFELQQRLKEYAVKGRWKHVDNFHLTLKFLDEISLSQQEKIDETMEKIIRARKPFSLSVSGMDTFDGRDAIRVLWLGVAGDIPELLSLCKEVDHRLVPIGFNQEKRSYRPHITLGQDITFKCRFDEIQHTIGNVHFGPFKVNSVFLFKSGQMQRKRIYSKVSEYAFAISSGKA